MGSFKTAFQILRLSVWYFLLVAILPLFVVAGLVFIGVRFGGGALVFTSSLLVVWVLCVSAASDKVRRQ